MVGVDISQDGRALIGVGLDAHSRQLMVLWDISQLRFGGKVGALPGSRCKVSCGAIAGSRWILGGLLEKPL